MITFIHHCFSKPLARHLRKPEGILGRITAWLMNNTNGVMMKSALDTLDIKTNHRILDIGFGGGDSLGYLLSKADTGHVFGLEISATMIQQATSKFCSYIAQGHLSLYAGKIEYLPFKDDQFNRVNTLNTIYFWHDPDKAVAELYRVCTHNAIIVIAFRSKNIMQDMKFTQYSFKLYQINEVVQLLESAGFTDILVNNHDTDELGFTCVKAKKL